MAETWSLLVSLILVLAVDLITVAGRASLLHGGLLPLLTAADPQDAAVQRALRLTRRLPRLRASLNLVQILWRFLLAGFLLLFLARQPLRFPLLTSFGLLILAALLTFGLEWVVRARVSASPLKWALRLGPLAQIANLLVWPFVTVILSLSGEVQDTLEDSSQVIEDQLKSLLDVGEARGLIEKDEGRMLHSIFELGDTLAREIMVPRIDMLALDVLTPIPQAVDAFLEHGFSRLPVYQDNVDHILGLLFAKDLLRLWREGTQIQSLQPLLRPAYFVPEAKKINELLAEMQSQRIHMAIVVDEYGGVAGLVTLEDIVEEILGEIQDEYDQAEELPYQRLPNGDYLFLGRIDLDDFNEVLTSHLPKDEAETLGGFIYHRLGRVPSPGESLQVDNLVLTVEQVIGRRIRKVRASLFFPDSQKDEMIAHVDG